MVNTITRNSTPAAPIAGLLMVDGAGYGAETPVETVLHPQAFGSGHLVVWRPARLRRGTLALMFPTATAAHAAIAMLKTSYSFTLTAALPEASMVFVVRPGVLKPRLGVEGGDEWLVDVPYQEVTP